MPTEDFATSARLCVNTTRRMSLGLGIFRETKDFRCQLQNLYKISIQPVAVQNDCLFDRFCFRTIAKSSEGVQALRYRP